MAQKRFRDGLIAALVSGGDSRLAIDPRTGVNKYLCPASPASRLVAAASCTASPISLRGLARAADIFGTYERTDSSAARAELLGTAIRRIEHVLLEAFGAQNLADVILCPSGTDAMLTTACLLAAEQPEIPTTVILPCAAETGTGVPLAAIGHVFDGPRMGQPVFAHAASAVEIALRDESGAPLPDEAVNLAFARAASRVHGRAVVVLTHGTKTGLVAPTIPPMGADVIVDACQARIAPATVARYLGCGWPVVVTGSKFFGGPAFSGAVLFPKCRRPKRAAVARPAADEDNLGPDSLGMVLRWIAALDTIESFAARRGEMAAFLRARGADIAGAIAANPALVPVAGRAPCGPHWPEQPSIFTFAVRDPGDERRLLTASALKPVHAALAADGVLLGQPVSLGAFGGLRVALGARDLLDARRDNFPRLLEALERLDPRFPRREMFGPAPLPPCLPVRPDAVLARIAGG